MNKKDAADMVKTLRHIQVHLAQNFPHNSDGSPAWWRGSQKVFIKRHKKAQDMVYDMITKTLRGQQDER